MLSDFFPSRDRQAKRHDLTRTCHKLTRTCHNLARICHNLTRTSHNLTRICHNLTRTCHNLTRTCHNLTRTCHNLTQTGHNLTWICDNFTRTCHNWTRNVVYGIYYLAVPVGGALGYAVGINYFLLIYILNLHFFQLFSSYLHMKLAFFWIINFFLFTYELWIGAVVGQAVSWRAAFYVCGLPGFLASVFVLTGRWTLPCTCHNLIRPSFLLPWHLHV